MSERIICQGCGQRISVPTDYRRGKIQCPECGVITPVLTPDGKPLSSARGRIEDTPFDVQGAASQGPALAPLPARDPKPEPDIAALPDPPARPDRKKPKAEPELPPATPTEPSLWTCEHCGEWQPREPRGRKARCPVCKTPVPKPQPAKVQSEAITAAAVLARGQRPAVQPAEWSDDPEDSKPYRVDAASQMHCPGCGKPMEPEAILCIHCGHDLRQNSKTRTIYDPVVRRWDAGLARPFRWMIFCVWQCFAIPPVIWGAAHEGHAFYVIGGWLWLSLMAAFLTGTYDRIDLQRNLRGKVRVVKTWYFCFVPRPPQTVDMAQYEGIMVGQVHDLDFSDYIVLAAGIGFGLIPGIIWYVVFMRRDTYFVALTKDHGHPELWLYRGWGETRAKEIATVLRAAVLPEYSWY